MQGAVNNIFINGGLNEDSSIKAWNETTTMLKKSMPMIDTKINKDD
jgi:hypothetical protein